MKARLIVYLLLILFFFSASAQERQKPGYHEVMVGIPAFDFEKRLAGIEKANSKEIYLAGQCASLHIVVFKVRADVMNTENKLKELLDKIFSKNEYFFKEGITVSKLKEMCRDN